MRRTFQISNQTIKVLNGKAGAVAEEYGCEDKFIYAILADTQTDPFAKFVALFSAAKRAGCDVSHWLSELERICAKYEPKDAGCHREETAKLGKETADVTGAVLTDKPLSQQLSEVCEVIRQAEHTKRAVIAAINAENEGTSKGFVRDFAREVVGNRRAG